MGDRPLPRHAAAGGKAWLYRFDLAPESGPHRGLAIHGSELALVWDKLSDSYSAYLGPTGPTAERMAMMMHGAWVDFIRHGNPAHHAAAWPRFREARPATMVFGREAHLDFDIDPMGRALWKDWQPHPFDGQA